MFEFLSSHPKDPSFFIPIIVILAVILMICYLVIYYIKKDPPAKVFGRKESMAEDERKERKSLEVRYLLVYLLTRCNVWSKTAYLYALFSTYHGLPIQEIGVIYFIGAVCSLIGGPFTGNWADIYGRRLFCQLYNVSVIINLGLRLTGNRYLAYVAQAMAGFGNNLINSTFESWLVYEASKVFGTEKAAKDKFLKNVFMV